MLACFGRLLGRLPCKGDAAQVSTLRQACCSTGWRMARPCWTSWYLLQEAEQRRREQAAKSRQFTLGKIAYGKGLYPESRALLEQALNQEGPFSKLGGEIQLWLALAYQVGPLLQPVKLCEPATLQAIRCGSDVAWPAWACKWPQEAAKGTWDAVSSHLLTLPYLSWRMQACGQEAECIRTYKLIEDSHPSPKVRKQAADLRYIMEAPKLKLRPEERINLPLLGDLDRYV